MNVKLGVSNMNVSDNGYDYYFTFFSGCFPVRHTLINLSSKVTTKNLYPITFQ